MDIQTILECLNAVPVRATYGAVGDVLGVRPQVVPRLLGARRPEASWVVNGTTGEPTGYAADETDPRLPGTHVIRTGDELRACLEGGAAATPEAVPPDAVPPETAPPETAPPETAPPETAPPETAPPDAIPIVNAAPGPATPEPEPFAMNSDARWIIGTLVPVFLLVAGLLAAQIASVSRGLHTRIDEVNGRIDELAEQVGGVDAHVDDVRTAVQGEIAVLRSDVASIAARLPAVAPAPGGTEVPASDAGEQALEPDAPEGSPDVQETSPDPQPEPAADAGAPVVTPAPPGE